MIASYNFTDAGRRNKNAGSEIKDSLLLTAVSVARIPTSSYTDFPKP